MNYWNLNTFNSTKPLPVWGKNWHIMESWKPPRVTSQSVCPLLSPTVTLSCSVTQHTQTSYVRDIIHLFLIRFLSPCEFHPYCGVCSFPLVYVRFLYHSWSIVMLVDIWIVSFWGRGIANSAALSIFVHIFWCTCICISRSLIICWSFKNCLIDTLSPRFLWS